MERLQPPSALCLTWNLSENWKRFQQQYECQLQEFQKKYNSINSRTFLHVIGPESLEIYNTVTWTADGDNMKLDNIMEKFKGYCNPDTFSIQEISNWGEHRCVCDRLKEQSKFV